MGSPPVFLMRSVFLICLVFCVVFLFCLSVFVWCHLTNIAGVAGLSILDCPFGFPYRLFTTYCLSGVSNVAHVSGLSILDCPFGFPYRLFTILFTQTSSSIKPNDCPNIFCIVILIVF